MMLYDFLKRMSMKDLHKGTNWTSSRKPFQVTLSLIDAFSILRTSEFYGVTSRLNCLSKGFPVVF